MLPNIDRYKKELDSLIEKGSMLHMAMQRECFPDEMDSSIKKQFGAEAADIIKVLPSFPGEYQSWYSEAKALVKQLLPDRLSDFVRLYEKPKPRKDITYENYRIEDYLQGLSITRGWEKEKVAGPDAAIPHFRQQLAILKSVKARFESSLFDIRQLVQADLFDSELDAAKELAKHKFMRGAGALAGVVLERHLTQVCENHGLKVTKKAPGIADLNDKLKEANVIDIPQWRFVQHLADIRNLCDHSKKSEPKAEQVNDLVDGVMKITKTVF
ncbi:MAG: hypothetical protein QMD08_00760 [Actinomycetota bacterium]|nr:hypothetical protein [Actinomycetota bacterium]